MSTVVQQVPVLTDAVLSPQEVYANGLELAKEVDRINRKAGRKSGWAVYWRKTYGASFGGR